MLVGPSSQGSWQTVETRNTHPSYIISHLFRGSKVKSKHLTGSDVFGVTSDWLLEEIEMFPTARCNNQAFNFFFFNIIQIDIHNFLTENCSHTELVIVIPLRHPRFMFSSHSMYISCNFLLQFDMNKNGSLSESKQRVKGCVPIKSE